MKVQLEAVEKPSHVDERVAWGSDVVARMLRQIGVKFVALNPGASFRGLHDSIVNHLGNHDPAMLLCLHEEHAGAIAHGYAKVTGEPMAVIMHSNVGLMHGSMSIFNAWCDRVPVLVLGATGPVEAALRRPWIDWIHTSRDQGALVRHFLKWDDQPSSVEAAMESILRANMIARTAPKGPTYINFDTALQESAIDTVPPMPEVGRYMPPFAARPSAEGIKSAVELLRKAKSPVILAGRCSRDTADWARRAALAEALDARVLTDMKVGRHSLPAIGCIAANHPIFLIRKRAQYLRLPISSSVSIGSISRER